MKAGFPDLCLTMVGPHKGDGSLQETQPTAQSLGVADRVHLPGALPKPDVPLTNGYPLGGVDNVAPCM